MPPQNRYFIAFTLEGAARAKVSRLRSAISTKFDVHAALKSPPHATLKYPFDTNNIKPVADAVKAYAEKLKPSPLSLKNFNHFDDRVWYVQVKPNRKQRAIQSGLVKLVRKTLALPDDPHETDWTPHVTLAYKDLTPEKFKLIKNYLSDKNIDLKIPFNNITILKLVNHKWRIYKKFRIR